MIVYQCALGFQMDTGREYFEKIVDHPHDDVRCCVQVQHHADGKEAQHGTLRKALFQLDELVVSMNNAGYQVDLPCPPNSPFEPFDSSNSSCMVSLADLQGNSLSLLAGGLIAYAELPEDTSCMGLYRRQSRSTVPSMALGGKGVLVSYLGNEVTILELSDLPTKKLAPESATDDIRLTKYAEYIRKNLARLP